MTRTLVHALTFSLLALGTAGAQTTPLPPAIAARLKAISGGQFISGTPVEIGTLLTQIQGGPGSAKSGAADETGQAGEEADKKPVDPQRLQAFQQVAFDRRPSTILKEWSKPDPLLPEEDPELAEPEEPKAPEGEEPKAPKSPEAAEASKTSESPEGAAVEEEAAKKTSEPAVESAAPAGNLPEEKAVPDAPSAPEASATTETPTEAAEQAEPATEPEAGPPVDEEQAAYEALKKAWDKDQAEYKKAQAKYTADKAQIKAKRLAREVEIYKRNVTLGRWQVLPPVLESFGKKGAKQMYKTLLQKLATPPPEGGNNQLQPYWEKNAFEFADILSLIEIAPEGFDNKEAKQLIPLLKRCFAQGHGFEDWVQLLRTETGRPTDERRVDRRLAVKLLTAQGRNKELGEFLPPLAELVEADDRDGMNLLARHFVALEKEEPDDTHLANAWEATLAALAPGEIEDEQKTEALKRAVDLASQVQGAMGTEWLTESFTTRPDRGMEVLATIGADASKAMAKRANLPDQRVETLELLSKAIGALLETAPERADEWQETLNLLADVWLREAAHSYRNSQTARRGGYQQRDSYGNVYWINYGGSYRNNPVRPLEPSALIELRPDGAWYELLAVSLRPKIDQTIAELYLKVNEEKEAFPYIKKLAPLNPDKADELAAEFLNVWILNNDPNASRNRSNIYNFSFGFNQRASGIPLTRSKQERNLRDLAEWVHRLRSIDGLELDSDLLVRAFTASHSAAEIYRIETMEEVFGNLEDLDPKTLARMAQTMRANLANVWRQPAVQRNAGTKRKRKDIEAEVQRGYALAQGVLGRAIEAHPQSWRLQVARAAMAHDLNNYRNELQKSSDFAERRREALEMFAGAASTYIDGLGDVNEGEWTAEAFEFWFRASLGASDIPAIDQSTILARHQIPRIKAALDGLVGERGERHRSMFANTLFTQLTSLNPSVKDRFLETGFEIVGDHPQAKAAREVYDYYHDLITEIEVIASIDGDSDVGTEPFGVRVDIRYTKEIQRESGGFAKYLQNQANAVNTYYYNGGRPPENYRDKFEESVRTILAEQFDIQSITFNKEDAASKADADFGWRRMSYAYLLLKAKGPEVDRLPPLKLDLDFNDVTGYVVLPISSPVVPLDASRGGPLAPYENLQVTQILDERKSDEGLLAMEIKAQADGLVPALDQILQLDPADFEVEDVTDQGVSVARFSDDEEGVLTERVWNVTMRPRQGVKKPEAFHFAGPIADSTQVIYQRYDDADLMTATQQISLAGAYTGGKGLKWWWLVAPVGLALLFALMARIFRGAPRVEIDDSLRMPDDLSPFSVLAFLRQARSSPRLVATAREDLDSTVHAIERHFFGDADGPTGSTAGTRAPDLALIIREWHAKAC